ncbi:MAG: CpaF family protein [Synergistales bacterium]|jgi:pilus assembly protein CpaF
MSLLKRLAGRSSEEQREKVQVSGAFRAAQRRLLVRLAEEVDPKDLGAAEGGHQGSADLRKKVVRIVDSFLAESAGLSAAEQERLREEVLNEVFGYGPIQPLIDDESVSEVMVNGPDVVYVERRGRIELTDVVFADDEHVKRILDRIVSPLGRRIDESSPMVDARLPDGSRVNGIIPPLALEGPTITIRKFRKTPLTTADLITYGTLSEEAVAFIRAAVEARFNVVIVGGTGSGKTTLLNVLSGFIPENERILTVEDAAELKLQQPHVVRLEARPANIEGKGSIPIRSLVKNSLRMRPDRIIVGECRGGEAFDMLQAMNTGHDGSMTTIHANSARDALARMESMVMMSGLELPLKAIRDQIASAVDLLVYQERLRDGTRRVMTVTEITGMEGEIIQTQDLFHFDHQGFDDRGRSRGRLRSTGIQPKNLAKFELAGVDLPTDSLAGR